MGRTSLHARHVFDIVQSQIHQCMQIHGGKFAQCLAGYLFAIIDYRFESRETYSSAKVEPRFDIPQNYQYM
jgi:hypothetical protein